MSVCAVLVSGATIPHSTQRRSFSRTADQHSAFRASGALATLRASDADDAVDLVAPELHGVRAAPHADRHDDARLVVLREADGAVLHHHRARIVGRVLPDDDTGRVLDDKVEILNAVARLRVRAVAMVGLRVEG